MKNLNARDKIEIGVTAVAVLLLVIAITSFSKKDKHLERAKEEAGPAALSIKEDTSYNKLAGSTQNLFGELQERTKGLRLGRDPFVYRPMITRQETGSGFRITGILWDENSPQAIINGKVVSIGDKVGANMVIDIKQDGVILNDGFSDFELKLGR